MLKFSEYHLAESIYVKDDEVIITSQAHRSASTADEISTYIGLQPKKAAGKNVGGMTTFSIFSYKSNKMMTNVLKAVKGDGGPYTIKPESRKRLINQGAEQTAKWIERHNIDVMVYPKSSSPFVKEFVAGIKKHHPKDLMVMTDAIVKVEGKKNERGWDDFIDGLINTKDPDWDKLSDSRKKNLKRDLLRGIKENVAEGKGAIVTLKYVYKPNAHFVKNFMKLSDNDELLHIMGKKVLIVDDVLSSGTSIVEMKRVVSDMEPSEMLAFTFFKGD